MEVPVAMLATKLSCLQRLQGKKPKESSKSHLPQEREQPVAFGKLRVWAQEQGASLNLSGQAPWTVVPSHSFLPSNFQWRLVRPLNNRGCDKTNSLPYTTKEELADAIEPGHWEHLDHRAPPLINFMNSIHESTLEEYATMKGSSRNAGRALGNGDANGEDL